MLKKMRWRFIGAAMASFLAVILILLCVINSWNYGITVKRQDATLKHILEFDKKISNPLTPGKLWKPKPVENFPPEMRDNARFFLVRCDENGTISEMNREHIASISFETAKRYTEQVLSFKKQSGYYKNYRYVAERTKQETTIIFLNAERELQSVKVLLVVSGITALISSLAVFLLVVFFSKQAIAPYLRNIETQKRFITDAGHELKTPLTAISTSADILAMDEGENEWVQNIQSQSVRLSKLISALVTLSRLDEEQPFPEKTDFSLSEAIWELSEPVAAAAKAQKKEYTFYIQEGIMLHGDRNAIQQMVSILLDNALKYSEEEGSIRLEVQKHQKKVKITVCNTCSPLDKKHLDKLFDRFYRPDESRSGKTGGTGIGLSIAKATAEAHGGKITVKQEEKQIVFTIMI